ncbi:MAG: (d)CMP kinase [Mucinivorans sp.]
MRLTPPSRPIIIAIDGYSSCGKSSFAKSIAAALSYAFIDTGAMYRAVTLWALEQGIQDNKELIVERLPNIDIHFSFNKISRQSDIFLGQDNISVEIRSMRVSNMVSHISQIAAVREKLVALQQQMGLLKGIVMDGRDIGTVVFPQAEIKIFMTASVEIRALRRYHELKDKGQEVALDEIRRNVSERDFQDENRAQSPLRRASDALLLDNSNMTPEAQMQWLNQILIAKNF